MSAELRVAYERPYPISDLPVSEHETMPFKRRDVYDAQGQSAVHLVTSLSSLLGIEVGSILDFPCGHGRIMRAFRAAFPDARLVACDLDERGVSFCAETFGAVPVLSSVDLATVDIGSKVDIVWIGSLLTHVDPEGWNAVFDFAERSVRDGGLIVATYAGAFVAEMFRAGDYRFADPDEAERALSEYDATGFGFMQYNTHDRRYGQTVTSYEWASRFVAGRAVLRPVVHFERGWAARQTVIAAVREPAFAGTRTPRAG